MPRASFNPGDFVQGGGLWQGGPAIIRNPRIAITNGSNVPKYTTGVTALIVDFEHLNGEGEVVMEPAPYSAGNGFLPSEDGENPTDPVEGEETAGGYVVHPAGNQLTKSSNLAFFIQNAANAGLEIPDDIRELDGTKVMLARIPQPERGGMANPPAPGKDKPSILVPTSVLEEVPWEKVVKGKGGAKAAPGKAAPAKAGTKAAPSKAAPAASSDVDEDTLVEIMTSIVAANPKGITKAKLAAAIFREVQGNRKDLVKSQQGIMKGIVDDEFLSTHPDVWGYEDGVITPA